jgi:hypothetical protein
MGLNEQVPLITRDNLSGELKKKFDEVPEDVVNTYKGFGGRKMAEAVPSPAPAECEWWKQGNGTNAWLTLGRDRPSSRASGYGGIGATQAAAIDICVGKVGVWKNIKNIDADVKDAEDYNNSGQSPKTRAKHNVGRYAGSAYGGDLPNHEEREYATDPPKNYSDLTNKILVADNDFKSDAARIYISERTDVDYNFGIARGKAGGVMGGSAIAIKADAVRVIAREGIKLVTRPDDTNSKGGNQDVVMGIDLIAGDNDGDLQPLVKGENLRDLLRYMLTDIHQIASMVHSLTLSNMMLETMLAMHTHPTNTGIAFPDPILGTFCAGSQTKTLLLDVPSHIKKVIEQILLNFEFLKPMGAQYICSKSNHTN